MANERDKRILSPSEQFVNYRLDELKDDVERNRADQNDRLRYLERDLQTAFRRIDAIALKVGLIGALGGSLGYALLQFVVQKLSK